MPVNHFAPIVEWHEKVSEIHSSLPEPTISASYTREAHRLEAEANKALTNRKAVVRLRAKELLLAARRHRYLAIHSNAQPDVEAQLKHELVAAQIRAASEKKDVTEAAIVVFKKFLSSNNAAFIAAVNKHPTAKILGLV